VGNPGRDQNHEVTGGAVGAEVRLGMAHPCTPHRRSFWILPNVPGTLSPTRRSKAHTSTNRNSWRAAYRRAVAQSAGRGRVGGDPSPAGVRHPKASWTTPATFSRLGGSGVDANDYRGSVGIAPVMCTGYSHGRIANRQLKRPEDLAPKVLAEGRPAAYLAGINSQGAWRRDLSFAQN
jgi:hypothetical protein